jgi:hypothetical protein
MKAARQVEAVKLMIASNTITVAHADAVLKATPPEQRTDVKPPIKEKKTAPIEQIVKLEKKMSQVQESYKNVEENYGSIPQPGRHQGLPHKAAGQRGGQELHRPAPARDPEPS